MRIIVLLFSFFSLSLAYAAASECLVIYTKNRPERFQVELAITPFDQQRGLMYRTQLDERHGMLFWYAKSQPLAVWMKNTPLSLDLLFIDDQGVISQIVENLPPNNSQEIFKSEKPNRAFLELVAGSVGRYGLAVGDRIGINLPPFSPAAECRP
jgi:uncharacterized membrane protein (UPF0127 family)